MPHLPLVVVLFVVTLGSAVAVLKPQGQSAVGKADGMQGA